MKKFSILLFCWCFTHAITGFAQTVNFEDGFEDGDFTNTPTWSGDTSQYQVIDGTPNHLLQLNGDSDNGGVSYLSTPSTNVVGSWEFYIDLGFNPSDGNRTDVFLMSDIANLEGTLNGYALRGGENGSRDVFRIVRYDGGSEAATVLSGTTDISSGGAYRVKVIRQSDGTWSMEIGQGYDGQLTQEGGTATDNTYTSAQYFGVRSTYSSTRATKFTYDFKIDLPPFTINQATANGNQVDVAFNRAYDQSTVQASDFSIDKGIGTPSSISFPATDTVRLSYGSALPSNSYTATAQNIQSQNGKSIEADAAATFAVFADFAAGDVIINEFMKDPPSGQAEYVELKNTSGKYLNLKNWEIGENSGKVTISTDDVVLQPNKFVVISSDTSSLFTAYGSRSYVKTGLGALNNGTDDIVVNTGDGTQVDSLQYDADWGGSKVAIERRSDIAPSIYKENFGDSPNDLGGTPGQANEVADDTTPPGLDNFIITGNQTLDLDFSERLDQTNATDTGNYSLDNGISVSSAQQTAGDSVRLSLGAPLQNGTTYHLTITNQQDIFANTAASIDTSFTYYVVSPADSGDVFINEFTYDPPSGSTEYIELYNPTSKSLDLDGWTLNDNSGNPKVITNARFVIPPDSFAVLAPDNTLLNDYPDINLVNVGSNFPSLNNTGEEDIVIRDSTGVLLDSLQYTSDWGGSGVALERRTVNAAAFKANFGDAPNGFGTPGSANQISADTTPPDLAAFSILDNQSLEFVFTEQVDQTSATNTSNYSISGGLNVNSAVLAGGDTVRIGLSGTLQNNTKYTATINGVKDRFGNAIANKDTSFTYYIASPADSGDVFINEFTYDPPDQSTEYVELYNTSSKSLDLNGWTLNDNTGNRKTITSSRFIIPPDSFAVIAPNQDLLQHNPDIALVSMGSRFPSLNNSGDNIVIRKADGTLLDSLTYTTAYGGNNVAVERRSTQAPPVQANFGDAPNGFGTPGSQNQIGKDTTPPELTAFSIFNNQILKLAFSEDLKSGPATTAGNYTLNHGITVSSATQTAGDSVRLSLSGPLQNAVSYQLTIKNQQDIFGNAAASKDTVFTYYQTSQADSGDVFINEFTYDPPDGSTEYVELYNTSSKSLDLNGWTINDNTGKRQVITSSSFVIPPDSFAVLAPDQTLLSDHPNINLLTLGSRFPSLNNSGDNIVIRRADATLLDSLTYTSAYGGNSVAVERRSTKVPPGQSNFGDAPNGFGTPGSQNQIGKDTVPPGLSKVIIRGRQTLDLVYTEGIMKEPASNSNNYAIDHGITVNNAMQTASDSVRLSLSSPLQNGITYTLSISKQQDIFGNTAASIDTTFQVTADTTGPALAAFTIPDSQTLKLAFSENIKNNPATDTDNFSLTHGITISSATQTAGDSVSLHLSGPLQNAVSYQLTITNQQDTFDNTTASIDTLFTYYKTSSADSGDVFINEFTYDPPTGSTEYVELYNTSSKSLDLKGWTINDNTGKRNIITSGRFIIPPDSFAVLAPDETLLEDYPGINLITLGGRFPSLNNSGDDIVIRRADGIRLDSLTYTTAFGGNNKATERRTTKVPPIQANFGDAPNGFGTPGSVNDIQADTTPPTFEALRILDESTLQLIFSEAISGNTATDASNYSISPEENIHLISAIEDTVTLFLSQPLQSDQTYSVTVQNLQDVFGNTIVKTTLSQPFIKISQGLPGDVVINEVLYAGDPEFVELYNRSDKNIDLSGWKIGDASGTTTIDADAKLPAKGYFVLTRSSSLGNSLSNGLYLSSLPSYNGDEDAVYIQNKNSTTIDSLFYTAAFGGTVDGTSTERKDPASPSNDASNFASSRATAGSTPGAKNSTFMRDTTPPKIIFSKLLAGTVPLQSLPHDQKNREASESSSNNIIQVQFDEFIVSPDSATFLLGDKPLSIASFDPTNGNVLFLNAPPEITSNSDLTITAKNVRDAEGNKAASTQISVAQPLQTGDVVINEIMYDPISNSDDNLPDQSEYIELRNTRDFAISLEGLALHDAPDENGNVRTLTPVSTDARYIPAQGTALIYAEDQGPAFEQSRVEQFFKIQNTSSSSLIRVDRSSLSLASSGDAIYLAQDNATIDSVFYDETWQNPNLADTKGIALERINPAGPSNTKDNWGSSTDPRGGTPNEENTLFQTPGEINQHKVSIKISPDPFSPDGDARDETTTISYNLGQPDYLISVDIYDRYGRLVRKLADSKPAGIKGSLVWDGLKDDGSTNRIGIYIVIFKAYDSSSGNNVAFKKTVVLARLLH